jgi:hypothetical protein
MTDSSTFSKSCFVSDLFGFSSGARFIIHHQLLAVRFQRVWADLLAGLAHP